MPQGYLTENCAIDYVEAAASAATTTLTTDVLDMQGYDGVTFIAALGDVTDTSVLLLSVFENTANSTSSPTPTAISGATAGATAGASNYDSTLLVVDVQKPSKRYVYATLARGTANAVVNGVLAIRYKGSHSCPVTQGATVMQLTKVQGGN
jgi:hypothetical protein